MQFDPVDPKTAVFDYTELQRAMDQVKTQIFLDKQFAAFLGSLMCSLNFVWTTGIKTAGTDGVQLIWNPEFFLKMPQETNVTIMLHELWHVAYLHPLRGEGYIPRLANKAMDIVINDDLVRQGYSWLGFKPWLGRGRFTRDQPWEEVYDILFKEGNWDDDNPWGEETGDLFEPTDAMKREMINNVVRSTQVAKMSYGNVPGETEEFLQRFLVPKLPWGTLLQRWLRQFDKSDYSMRRPARRTHAHDLYLPTIDSSNRLEHLIWYMDVSGSMGPKEVQRIASELRHIKQVFKPKKMTVVQFDTRITDITEWDHNDPFEGIMFKGGGGTDLREVRQHIIDTKPTAAIIFSDMWLEPMKPGPTCPILWVAIDNPHAEVPFGKLIHLTE